MNPNETIEQNWTIANQFITDDEFVSFKSFDSESNKFTYSAYYYDGHTPNRKTYEVEITISSSVQKKWMQYVSSKELIDLGGKITVKWIKTY